MPVIPWWLNILISGAIRFGLPFLVKKVGLPADVTDFVKESVDEIKASTKTHKKTVKEKKAETKRRVRAMCSGVGCPSDTVKE